MRKLGAGQSVTFCVSPEMRKRIRSLGKVDDSRQLTVNDVLVCAIAETWDDAHRSVPLWATQGIRHQHQEVVWDRVSRTGELSVQDIRDYLEEEAQSLEQRYRPASEANGTTNRQSISSKLIEAEQLESRQAQVDQIKAKCIEFGLANIDAMGNLQEEQERELAPEVERERQVERPPAQKPADHSLHNDVREFAASGILKRESPAFLPAFQSLAATSGAKLFPVATFPSSLLVTADFARTIKSQFGRNDAFHRPVQWLLTQAVPSTNTQHMVIVSSWEANLLKPLLRSTTQPSVHLRGYLPRSSLSYPTLEDLTTYTIPRTPTPAPAPDPHLITQLNLFAGQLYLRSYADYTRMCRYLGLAFVENEGEKDIAADGFVGKGGGEGYEACGFGSSPVAFLGMLMKTVRRDCLDVGGTHVGRLLAGEILRRADFEG